MSCWSPDAPVRGADLVAKSDDGRQDGGRDRCGGRGLRGRRARRRPAMTGETGTHELADGRPGYRLVRCEDIELTDALRAAPAA